MRIPVALTFTVEDEQSLQAALDALTRWNRQLVKRRSLEGRPFVGLFQAGVRYQRERPRVVGVAEDWQNIERLFQSRRGDCEDLACALAAQLPGARAVPYRTSTGWHIVVRQGDGSMIDPSAILGMR